MFAVLFIADFALHAVLRTEQGAKTAPVDPTHKDREPSADLLTGFGAEEGSSKTSFPSDAPAALFDGQKRNRFCWPPTPPRARTE